MTIDASRIEEIVSEIRRKIQSHPIGSDTSDAGVSVAHVAAIREDARRLGTSMARLDEAIAIAGEQNRGMPSFSQ